MRNLAGFRADYELLLSAIHRHFPNPGRIFVDGVKFNSRVAALLEASFPVGGIIHLYRDPVDLVASSMRNTGRGDWRGVLEHALRYRLYHARARQLGRDVSYLPVHYESLAYDIHAELARMFGFLGVAPMSVAQLRPNFDQEWCFMGNSSLFRFDGVIPRSSDDLAGSKGRWVKRLAGIRKGA